MAYLVPIFWYHFHGQLLDYSAWLGFWPWAWVSDSVALFYKEIIVKKKQEIGFLSIVRNHVLSTHCEAISWNLKLHAILLILCVYNITKYSYLYYGSGQLYDKH